MRSMIQSDCWSISPATITTDHCVSRTALHVFCRSSVSALSQKISLRFSDISPNPKRLGIFSPNFTRLLHFPIYARLQIFIQLPATLTKLCHINRDHPVHTICWKLSTIGRNARWHFLTFSPNSWELLVEILHVYFTFLSTVDYKFLFNYIQLWRSLP